MDGASFSTFVENKETKMKMVVNSMKEYLQNGTNDGGLRLHRNLQLLSNCTELSIFDPDTIVSIQFYSTLYSLMNKLDPWSETLWSCVDILNNVCKNSSARRALIQNYQFVSALSRMLGDQLTTERRISLLKLIQDLTCGIIIEGQIPFLFHLMSTLSKWVQSQNNEIVTFSLGILVNICYKNPPAMYAFYRSINVKEFLKYSLSLQGSAKELHVCQLSIMLNEHTPFEDLLVSFIDRTFQAVDEAYLAKDAVRLRQTIEFFSNCRDVNKNSVIFGSYERYKDKIQGLLSIVENRPKKRKVEHPEGSNPECTAIILEFLSTLIKLKVPSIRSLYFEIIQFAMKWIQVDVASEEALHLLRVIATNIHENDNIINTFAGLLPTILQLLSNKKEYTLGQSIDYTNRTSAVLQLLHVLLQMQQIRPLLVESLTQETISDVFQPLLSDFPPKFSVFNTDRVSLYIFALATTMEMAKYSQAWVELAENLLRDRIVQSVMVYAVYKKTSIDVKTAFLSIATNSLFPQADIAKNMSDLQSLFITSIPKTRHNTEFCNQPLLTMAQIQRLDNIREKLDTLLSEGNALQISTADVIELYEFKLAGFEEARKTDQRCIKEAEERTKVIGQMTEEQNRLHQVLLYTQRRYDETLKQKESESKMLTQKLNDLETEKKRSKTRLVGLEQQVKELDSALALLTKEIEEKTKELRASSTRCTELEHVLEKVEETCKRQEKRMEKKEESLKELTSMNNALEERIRKLQQDLKTKDERLEYVQEELEKKTNLIVSITQMALRGSQNANGTK